MATPPAPPAQPQKSAAWLLSPWTVIGVAALLLFGSRQIAAYLLIGGLYALGWDSAAIENWLLGATFAQFLYIFIVEIIIIGGVVLFLRSQGLTLRAIAWNRFRLSYIWQSAISYGAYFLLFLIIATVAGILIPSLDVEQAQQIGFAQSQTTIGLLLVFVSLVILPPLMEEIVFRGLIFTSLRKKLSFALTTLITSILFAIPHLQFESDAPPLWIAAIDTLVLSFVLCYVREKSGSLWPPMLIHALKNGIAFAALFLFA